MNYTPRFHVPLLQRSRVFASTYYRRFEHDTDSILGITRSVPTTISQDQKSSPWPFVESAGGGRTDDDDDARTYPGLSGVIATTFSAVINLIITTVPCQARAPPGYSFSFRPFCPFRSARPESRPDVHTDFSLSLSLCFATRFLRWKDSPAHPGFVLLARQRIISLVVRNSSPFSATQSAFSRSASGNYEPRLRRDFCPRLEEARRHTRVSDAQKKKVNSSEPQPLNHGGRFACYRRKSTDDDVYATSGTEI